VCVRELHLLSIFLTSFFPLDLLELPPCRAYSREDRRIFLLDFRCIRRLLVLQCEGPTHPDPNGDISFPDGH
jgi:hypothetical protein